MTGPSGLWQHPRMAGDTGPAPPGSTRSAGGGLALVAAVAVVLALAVLTAGAAGPAPRDPSSRIAVDTAPLPTPSPTPTRTAASQEQSVAEPVTVEVSAGQMVLVGAVLMVALAALLLRPGSGGRAPVRPVPAAHPGGAVGAPGAELRPLEGAVEDAASQLARPGSRSTQDAVIACWLRLEEGAAAAGTARRPAQTPTEFTAAVLAGATGPGDAEVAVRDLLHLYHRARFGSRPLEEGAAERAAADLDRIRAGLAARRPGAGR